MSEKEELSAYDVLDWIGTAYWGKQMYFMQNDGTIYDRYKCDYVSLEEAVRRLAEMIGYE